MLLGMPVEFFADTAALMGAHAVEIAQQGDIPLGIRGVQVAQNPFDHGYGYRYSQRRRLIKSAWFVSVISRCLGSPRADYRDEMR